MKPDAASAWSTAPVSARLAGDQAYRVFDTAEEALDFVVRSAKNSAKQKRYRARRRDNAVVLRGVALPGPVVEALAEWARLDIKAGLDPQQIEREAVAVLVKWCTEWSAAFSETKSRRL
jgi:hypothetical protein